METSPLAQGQFIGCKTTGCLHRAEYLPKVCVPAQGFPVEAGKHMSAIVDVPLCEDCLVNVAGDQFMTDQLRTVFDKFAAGKVPPDYSRSFVLPVAMTSEEYRRYKAALAKTRQ